MCGESTWKKIWIPLAATPWAAPYEREVSRNALDFPPLPRLRSVCGFAQQAHLRLLDSRHFRCFRCKPLGQQPRHLLHPKCGSPASQRAP